MAAQQLQQVIYQYQVLQQVRMEVQEEMPLAVVLEHRVQEQPVPVVVVLVVLY